ncbi:MAG: FadR family transcriptional regulator [Rhizobium sp.]|nr:FadR family transcriptional regulator [Rhizobium sp.]
MVLDSTGSGDRTSAVDQLVGQMRDLIRDRKLKVGDALPSEVEMAEMFGASRNTAREAIRVLKTYGILESRQKVGAVLTDRRSAAMMDAFSFAIEISADAFHDIQGFRRLIEVNLAETLVQKVDAADLVRLEEINVSMREASNPVDASWLDFQFHGCLVGIAGLRTLSEVYGMLEPIIRKLMENGKSQRRGIDGAYEEHCDIIGALRKRDRIAFAYHMHRHLDAGLEFISAASDISTPQTPGNNRLP